MGTEEWKEHGNITKSELELFSFFKSVEGAT